MKKRLLTGLVASLGLGFILPFALPNSAHADEVLPRATCTMTISDKNTQDNPAESDGVCKGIIYGDYANGYFNMFGVSNYPIDYSGEKFVVSTPNSTQYVEANLTVYTTKTPKVDTPITQTPKPSVPTKPVVTKPKQPIVITLYQMLVTQNYSPVHTVNSGSAKVFTRLNTNSIVNVVEVNKDWYKIKIGSGYGWIYSKYVSKNLAPRTLYDIRVTRNYSSVFTTNSTKSHVIKHGYTNDTYQVVQQSGNWYKVKVGSGYGWIYSSYVSKNLAPQSIFTAMTTSSTSVRTNSNNKSYVFTYLRKNTKVGIVQQSGSWYRVRVNSHYGWIQKSSTKRI